MKIYATKDVLEFWEQQLQSVQRARSLAASRLVRLASDKNDKDWRKGACEAICQGAANYEIRKHDLTFADTLVKAGAFELLAKLEARLIINAGDGVIENGGIAIDRNSGYPFIPGSAVKACARRMAIHQLGDESDPNAKAELLANLAEVFGYADQDWKPGRKHNKDGACAAYSDFWLAMIPFTESGVVHDERRNTIWQQVSKEAVAILKQRHRIPTDHSLPKSMSGQFSFLAAFPGRGTKLELDVLTSHHGDYYNNGEKNIATDDENPNPVFFPVIAQGTSFRFIVYPLARANSELHKFAENWLREGLAIFGLGAKTNAGYGWFYIDEDSMRIAKNERNERQKKIDDEAILIKMTPLERSFHEISKLKPDQFADHARNLSNQSPEYQIVICQLLAETKSDVWKEWCKPKAKKWQSRLPAIREIAQSHGIQLP